MGDRLATIDTGLKLGGCVPLVDGEVDSQLTQCGQAEAYHRTEWHLDPSSLLATTGMSRKLGGGCAPLGEAPHLTQCGLS